MKYLIILLLFISCSQKTEVYSYEHKTLLETGEVRIVKYWFDKDGNIIAAIDTIK